MFDFNEQLEKLHMERESAIDELDATLFRGTKYIHLLSIIERLDDLIDIHVSRYVKADVYINRMVDSTQEDGLELTPGQAQYIREWAAEVVGPGHTHYIDELLEELDTLATHVNEYDYGLPLHHEHNVMMRNVVSAWMHKHDIRPKESKDEG